MEIISSQEVSLPLWDILRKNHFLTKEKEIFLSIYKIISIIVNANWDVAQLGSALPWGGRGRQFKSDRSDQ